MTKQELLDKLKECQENEDIEKAHIFADKALCKYINDEEITKAFRKVERWYA